MNRIAAALGVCLIVLVALDVALVTDRHVPPGLAALTGVLGAGVIVAVAKGVATLLQRPAGRHD